MCMLLLSDLAVLFGSRHNLAFPTSPIQLSAFSTAGLQRFAKHVSSPCGGFRDSFSLTSGLQPRSPLTHNEPFFRGNLGSSPQLLPRSARHQCTNMRHRYTQLFLSSLLLALLATEHTWCDPVLPQICSCTTHPVKGHGPLSVPASSNNPCHNRLAPHLAPNHNETVCAPHATRIQALHVISSQDLSASPCKLPPSTQTHPKTLHAVAKRTHTNRKTTHTPNIENRQLIFCVSGAPALTEMLLGSNVAARRRPPPEITRICTPHVVMKTVFARLSACTRASSHSQIGTPRVAHHLRST